MNVENFEHELSILILPPQMLLVDFSNHGKMSLRKNYLIVGVLNRETSIWILASLDLFGKLY